MMRGLTFVETIIVALITAIISSLLTTLLQRRNEQIKFLREKLFDRYSEFVAIVSAELDRAKAQAATATCGREDQDYTDFIQDTHKSMKENRAQLARLALQIGLFEKEDIINAKVKELAKNQPFMMFIFPPRWGDSIYQERFNKFESEIGLFEQNITELVNMILNKHSRRVQNSFFHYCGQKLMGCIQTIKSYLSC